MTDQPVKPVHRCTFCGHDQGSKFALKRHREICRHRPGAGRQMHFVNGRRV